SRVQSVSADDGSLDLVEVGERHRLAFDHLVLATDPLSAARLVGDEPTIEAVGSKRVLGTSGKLTLLVREPIRWRARSAAPDHAAAFRFLFSVETVAEFERASLRVTTGESAYEPGYIQVYCEGAAMRQLGLVEPFDRLTLFFKNVALDRR